MVLLPRRHPLAEHRTVDLADLRGEPLILAPSPAVRQELLRACARAGFVPDIAATAGGPATERLAATRIGIALVPASAAPAGRRLAIRPVADLPPRSLLLTSARRERRFGAEVDFHAALVAAAAARTVISRHAEGARDAW